MTPQHPEIQTLGIDDLISMDVPVRAMLLDPILPAKGLMMIHAARGGSKTFLALAMGTGGLCRHERPALVSTESPPGPLHRWRNGPRGPTEPPWCATGRNGCEGP
jgi:hypothetical protein